MKIYKRVLTKSNLSNSNCFDNSTKILALTHLSIAMTISASKKLSKPDQKSITLSTGRVSTKSHRIQILLSFLN